MRYLDFALAALEARLLRAHLVFTLGRGHGEQLSTASEAAYAFNFLHESWKGKREARKGPRPKGLETKVPGLFPAEKFPPSFQGLH